MSKASQKVGPKYKEERLLPVEPHAPDKQHAINEKLARIKQTAYGLLMNADPYAEHRAEINDLFLDFQLRFESDIKFHADKHRAHWAQMVAEGEKWDDGTPLTIPEDPTKLEERLLEMMDGFTKGKPLDQAAADARFKPFTEPLLPPIKRARMTLEFFCKQLKDKGGGWLEKFHELCPETLKKNTVHTHPSWLDEARKTNNYQGRCWSMSSTLEGITMTQDQDTGGWTVDFRGQDEMYQRNSLNRVLDLLLSGSLKVLDPLHAQGAGLKVECEGVNGTYLVCIHPQSDSRIYGIYDSKDGTIVWKGIAKDHKMWHKIIHEFRK